jgi:hypothetical protein
MELVWYVGRLLLAFVSGWALGTLVVAWAVVRRAWTWGGNA